MIKGTFSIITGHGGQGVLSSSKLLAQYYFMKDLDVKTSTLIGLGIRGGGVYSHLKSGECIHSPLVKAGEADVIIGFEKLETLRWLDYLKPNGLLIVNDQYIQPTTVSSGLQPDFEGNFEALFKAKTDDVYLIDGYAEIAHLKKPAVLNAFLLGFMAASQNHDLDLWHTILKAHLSNKHYAINNEAFMLGYHYLDQQEDGHDTSIA